ncbi:hypothetical protein [methane-oxidizing endosymbiont of Gigantopelta aegis]|uniref:hypothetical protein n=1 Tax=methane-oxidizing endosymbiont of Gigantopelta aegis TaxID=2794938 RepID=UPI0018DC1D02|nr:hypothetical protein [methane-oxidizing endosymbiont of Gigantopelta aegis]
MAKNFFSKLIDLAGLNLPDPNSQHDDPNKYHQPPKTDTNTGQGLTRVERYLQKKNPQPEPTRVEQYLAKKQQATAQNKTATETSEIEINDAQTDTTLTGVARYLAKKQAASKTRLKPTSAPQKPMTRVEKYLAQKQQAKASPQKKTVKAATLEPKQDSAPVTRVDKYLSRKKPASAAPTSKPEEKQITPVTEAAEKTITETKTEAAEKPTKTATTEKKQSSVIDHSENADQCQAATQKGTRCRRKSNLEVLIKTINKQKHRFAVCHQHHNAEFVPFAEFIKKTAE